MTIIYITQYLPYPTSGGGKIKSFSTLSTLRKLGHRIILFSFVTNKEELSNEKKLINMGFKIGKTIYNPFITDETPKIYKILLFLKNILSIKPFTVSKYYKKEMANAIKQIFSTIKVDCVWADQLLMAQYLPENFEGLKILETHDVDSLFFKRMALKDYSIVNKLFAVGEWLKFYVYEKFVFPKFTKIFAISHIDRYQIQEITGRKDVEILRPIIKKRKTIPSGRFLKNLLFIGSLKWYPNKDGIIWFLKHVYPLIYGHNFKVNIVGRLSKDLLLFQDIYPDIKFLGFVKNPDSFWKTAGIFIAPIRHGTGIRIKILEAMSRGLPIVATSEALEGLNLSDGREVLIANNGKEFSQKIIILFNNKKLQKNLVFNSYKYLKMNYAESNIAL